jgi:hypothetical protein
VVVAGVAVIVASDDLGLTAEILSDIAVVVAGVSFTAAVMAVAAWAQAAEKLARPEAQPGNPVFDQKMRSKARSESREWRSALFAICLGLAALGAAAYLRFWPW